ncbi:solute carrier family 28 member 3-like [Tubulanus polymorphus]|uniref:solute carrier family 28 member 3-like n=1 Tax=Tubulanus polymorphus TaxID=672921 RepID=UPI003DA3793A
MSSTGIQLQSMNQHDSGQPQSFDNEGFTNDRDNVVGDQYSSTLSVDRAASIDKSIDSEINLDHEDSAGDQDEKSCENACQRWVAHTQNTLQNCYISHKKITWILIKVLIVMLYGAYFSYAMYYQFGDEPSIRLLWITAVVIVAIIWSLVSEAFGEQIDKVIGKPTNLFVQNHFQVFKWVFIVLVLIALILVLVLEVGMKNPRNLLSGAGLIAYVLLCFVTSKNPSKVKWRPVLWGLGLQFVFALIILRTFWGYTAFKWAGDRVSEFLAHTEAGAEFVFGEKTYKHHFFAFTILPVIVFFSTIINILYYLGWMQVIIQKVAWVMQTCMGTTAAESLNAAANIFIGQSEAPLMIRPLLQDMTQSELHAVCTGGFATIAGSVMAAYIGFGVPANHLLSASVMSAPAALAISKLFWPETEESKTKADDVKHMEPPTEKNVIEAAANGASQSISLVANIAVNLIAFIALLHFLNSTLDWLGQRVGHPGLTFQIVCSYVLWPLAYVMGVDFTDCRSVAKLIGVKTFLNEFIAYTDLKVLISNREMMESYEAQGLSSLTYKGDDIFLDAWNSTLLKGGYMSVRSEAISTYALCGFSNFGSIGVVLGCLGALAPSRKRDLSKVVFRAMIAGNVACFMTACIAGLFFDTTLER